MADDGKFYWLKLKRDFFKRHDIRIIEAMPNGTEYLLFYLKLLVESVDHNGNLRFSDEIPYNDEMLAAVTNTNIDIVRSAVKAFVQLGMMEMLDDGTLYMRQVENMVGSAANNDNANRQRRFRESKKRLALQSGYASVTKDNESIEYRDKSIDIISSPNGEDCHEPVRDARPEEKKKTAKKKEPIPHDHNAYKAARWLSKQIRKRMPDRKEYSEEDLQRWADDIDKLNRIDGYEWELISDILQFSQRDKFWQSNILSGAKLRKQFETRMAQAVRGEDD